MGPMQTDPLACCHIIVHVSIHMVAMPSPLSTSLPCQQKCQFTRHHCYPRHYQVNSHVILHVINVWCGNWICDEIYIICDVYFRHRERAWVGLQGPGDFPWRFQNIMDQAIYDENLRNVTRCDLWLSIHDVIWDRHRYCFMMVFQWSVTKFNRHGSTDFL